LIWILLAAVPPAVRAQELATYESPLNGFSFDYPAHWQVGTVPMQVSRGENVERVAVVAPDGTIAQVTVTQLARRISDADVPVLKLEFDNVMQYLAEQIGGEVVHAELMDGSEYGRRYIFAYQIDYPRQSQTIESRHYSFMEADRQYSVVMEADASRQMAHAGVLEDMLASFTVEPR
jgi:hypothetical protein